MRFLCRRVCLPFSLLLAACGVHPCTQAADSKSVTAARQTESHAHACMRRSACSARLACFRSCCLSDPTPHGPPLLLFRSSFAVSCRAVPFSLSRFRAQTKQHQAATPRQKHRRENEESLSLLDLSAADPGRSRPHGPPSSGDGRSRSPHDTTGGSSRHHHHHHHRHHHHRHGSGGGGDRNNSGGLGAGAGGHQRSPSPLGSSGGSSRSGHSSKPSRDARTGRPTLSHSGHGGHAHHRGGGDMSGGGRGRHEPDGGGRGDEFGDAEGGMGPAGGAQRGSENVGLQSSSPSPGSWQATEMAQQGASGSGSGSRRSHHPHHRHRAVSVVLGCFFL